MDIKDNQLLADLLEELNQKSWRDILRSLSDDELDELDEAATRLSSSTANDGTLPDTLEKTKQNHELKNDWQVVNKYIQKFYKKE